MQFHRFESIPRFVEQTRDYLLQRQCDHTLLLDMLNDLRHSPGCYLHPPYLAMVTNQGGIVAIAVRTPPYPLVLSRVTDASGDTPPPVLPP